MTTLIERAIDTSILMFKTTAAEQGIAQSNPETTELPANLAQTAPPNAEGRVPEQQENSADQALLIPSYSLLPTVYNSVKSPPDWIPISSRPTIISDSTTSDGNLFDIPAHEAVSVVQQSDGNECSRIGDNDESTASISKSSKGKRKAIYPANDTDDYQDSHGYQEAQFGYINRPSASQDDAQQDMNTGPNFEDFYLDSGLEPDWNWFTEAPQRLV
jgi:hypothetical protein